MHHHSHDHHEHEIDQNPNSERYIATRNVTLIGVVSNIVLTILKLVFGWIGHSQALIADGLHSLSDLISDAVILVAAKISDKKADKDHPYGHGRFETVATVIVGTLLILVAIGMLMDAAWRLWFTEQLLQPTGITLAIAVISILVKEATYQYTIYVAEKYRSQMLRANAWHHRTDAVSSVIVFVGIVGAMAGFPWLDAVAAIGVSFMIIHIGWQLSWSGLRELVDTSLDRKTVLEIETIIKSVEGVRDIHFLRTRRMGANVLVDVHLLVSPMISVSEGHHIGEIVQNRLIDEMEEVADVVIHIDPEDDEKVAPSLTLPLRREVLTRLQRHWQHLDQAHAIENITLHYYNGRVSADIYLPLSLVEDIQTAQLLSQQFIEAVDVEPDIHNIRVYYY